MDTKWVYGDGDSGILILLCSFKTHLPLLEVLERVWVALIFSFFLFLFFLFFVVGTLSSSLSFFLFFSFFLESTQISILNNSMEGGDKAQLELY